MHNATKILQIFSYDWKLWLIYIQLGNIRSNIRDICIFICYDGQFNSLLLSRFSYRVRVTPQIKKKKEKRKKKERKKKKEEKKEEEEERKRRRRKKKKKKKKEEEEDEKEEEEEEDYFSVTASLIF